jgi:putative transcriptional regulator
MSTLFNELKAGLEEALDHAAGAPIAGRERTVQIERSEVHAARHKLGMTQKQFAVVLGASLETVRKWEQGTRAPSGAAARLIRIIAYRPSIVEEALGVLPEPAKRRPRRVA